MPGSTFDVVSGAVLVEVPTVVVVTRPTEQMRFLTGGVTFATGDTLYVLDYLGEGFVNAWYRDSMLEVEIFWPWDNFFPAPEFQYGGEVVQEGRTSFWVRIDRSPEEWVLADAASVAAPSSLDPDPPACRPTG